MTAAATKTHRVFDVINGLYPVTFNNVREADPAALLDIFEENTDTRDLYFEAVTDTNGNLPPYVNAQRAGCEWAESLEGLGIDHTDECYFSDGSQGCRCKEHQWDDNRQWGTEVYLAIQQRINELNG